jgi:uncharacterized protein (DUF433 family)
LGRWFVTDLGWGPAIRPEFHRAVTGLLQPRFQATIMNEAQMTIDWSQCPAVESIPGKVSGAWVLRGTRMPVQAIFENLEAGMSVEEITEAFDVTPEEVRAVLHFISESLEKAPS